RNAVAIADVSCCRYAAHSIEILTQSSGNSADSPCTHHGHHSGHHQPVFSWFHDLLQRRDQVIQCRRNGGGGGSLSAGRLNGRNASFLMGINDSTHSVPSFHLVPSRRGALVRFWLRGCATPLSQIEQGPCQGWRGLRARGKPFIHREIEERGRGAVPGS